MKSILALILACCMFMVVTASAEDIVIEDDDEMVIEDDSDMVIEDDDDMVIVDEDTPEVTETPEPEATAVPYSGVTAEDSNRLTFLLVCNEGMNNDGGNFGNTMMVVSMDPDLGDIRLLSFTWDTFIEYEGFDLPQLIDEPYRNNGPEETMRVFNANFSQNIQYVLSLNYLNLASLIDSFGGVNVDVTRAERNALNSMVISKKENITAAQSTGIIEAVIAETLSDGVILDNWGTDVHLNGFQAVAFGWLQYDSVYNCCLRERQVISDLFSSVSNTVISKAAFYTDETEAPVVTDGRRVINLDDPTDEDIDFLMENVAPIFEKSYNNLSDDEILVISLTFARAAYLASRQGINVMSNIETEILPLEARDAYDDVAGTYGHLIDYEANTNAINEFLYGTR